MAMVASQSESDDCLSAGFFFRRFNASRAVPTDQSHLRPQVALQRVDSGPSPWDRDRAVRIISFRMSGGS